MLYRTAQELLDYTIMYKKAKRIDVNLRLTDAITVTIEDDAPGGDEQVNDSLAKRQLESIANRVFLLNAKLKTTTKAGTVSNMMLLVPATKNNACDE